MITDAERARLAAILGMLGSAHDGERLAAARQAEAMRRKLGLSWDEVLRERVVVTNEPPAEPAREPPPQPAYPATKSPRPLAHAWAYYSELIVGAIAVTVVWGGCLIVKALGITL